MFPQFLDGERNSNKKKQASINGESLEPDGE